MKISTKGRYGLTLMISLAKREGQGCVSLKTIAEENKLSDLYLEQLVGPLRNAGLSSIRRNYCRRYYPITRRTDYVCRKY